MPRIAVFGGSGFLGKEVCKSAAQRGWVVTSISRGGEPLWNTTAASRTQKPLWATKVQWKKADIYDSSMYKDILQNVDAVVHSMGILVEADYKQILEGKASPLAGLFRWCFQAKTDTPTNPLLKNQMSGSPQQQHKSQRRTLSYEYVNRDSAIYLAKAYANASDHKSERSFVYISVAGAFPMIPSRYVTTKHDAEERIKLIPGLRSIFVRPGFMYSSTRRITIPLSYMFMSSSLFNRTTNGFFSGLLGAGATKPLDASVVAAAVVKALENEHISGVVDIDQIEQLSKQLWREGML